MDWIIERLVPPPTATRRLERRPLRSIYYGKGPSHNFEALVATASTEHSELRFLKPVIRARPALQPLEIDSLSLTSPVTRGALILA